MDTPKAKKHKTILEKHHDIRQDDYFWLNQRDDKDVLDYLEKENKFAEFQLKDTECLQEELFDEMKSRYKKDDISMPYFFNEYWYYTRYEEGKEYPFFCRKFQSLENEEEIMINANTLSENQSFFELRSASVSLDNQTVAFSSDTLGRRIYTIQFKNLKTGQILSDKIENTTGKIVWTNDNQHIFYIRKDENLRAFQVFRHQLGTDASEDVLIYHEKDDTFDVSLYKTKSQKYIFIASSSTLSDEHRFLPADDVHAEWQIVQPRKKRLEYSVEHHENYFYIITNVDDATNFKLMKTSLEKTTMEYWGEVIPHRENILLEGFEIFKNYLVLEERKDGLIHLNVQHWQTGTNYYLPFHEPVYTSYIGINLDFDTENLRYGYTSLTTPSSIFEFNMNTRTTKLLKQQEVLGGKFASENYISERVWVPSRDQKTEIPVSIVYHKDTILSEKTPILLYAYGSYGHTVDASFSSVRLSILDRGFIFAIAHIRGGEYLGRAWYEEGKMLKKKNTFNDFVDVAQFFVDKKYTSPKHLYAMGGSAGGLLMGVVANQAPELFNGIVAQVPFVDVVTTMLDENIPLTTGEYDEWGNPNDKTYYHYIKSYSPYDNVTEQKYPNMLITTGYHDSQVQYWEPAKWVAKLRDLKTDKNILIFKTDMSSGHGGASGRFESLKEDALEYAFLLKLEK